MEKAGKMPDFRLYFDGMPEKLRTELTQKARFLGAQMAGSLIECTHYIVPSLKRTLNLCEVLARGKAVIDPSWIEHSFRALHFIGELKVFRRVEKEEVF